jgi:putative membrane protein
MPIFITALALILSSNPVLAHGAGPLDVDEVLTSWAFTPEMVLLSALAVWIYARGIYQRRLVKNPQPWWRHLLFFSGLTALFLALQSPIDSFAERSFTMHQIQHFLLRMVGPMLVALSRPEGTLVAGLPRAWRKSLLAPLGRSTIMQAIGRAIQRPLVVFAIFVGSMYFWQIPPVHNLTLLNAPLHYLMHFTMLLAGMIFFWKVFERRHPPKGYGYAGRQFMLIGGIVSNILLGSITTLKDIVVYTAYDIQGRLFTLTALVDEQTGGYIIWVPSSMMLLVSILITLWGWNGYEEARLRRRDMGGLSNSDALEFPQTASELWIKVSARNRSVRHVLALVPLSIFAITMSTMITIYVWP